MLETQSTCSIDTPLCTCLEEKNMLTESQIDSLFSQQLDSVTKLFALDSAWFNFDEADNNKTSKAGAFPWQKMTEKQKTTADLSLESMRYITNWQRFAEDYPLGSSGLPKVAKNPSTELTSLENKLWDTADGSRTLKSIAQEIKTSLLKVQQTALALILAGFVE
ncbi:MAG: DUF4388 domain-containing protein [Cyanobacteria bacterium J06623_7]